MPGTRYDRQYAQMLKLFGYHHGQRIKKKLTIGQNEAELCETFAWLTAKLTKPVHHFVELGVNWGATFYLYSVFVEEGGCMIGVDAGLFPGIHDVHKVLIELKKTYDVQFLNRRTDEAVEQVRYIVTAPGIGTVELLHIDADHSYEGTKRDWELYAPMVGPGGIILLHDISYMEGTAKFWAEIKPELIKEKAEITEIRHPGGQGMACIKRA